MVVNGLPVDLGLFKQGYIISLIGKLARRFVSFIKLESIDRLLGAAFGILKGVFVVIVLILILIAFLPPAHPVLTKSRLSPYFMTLGEISISMIPVNLRQTVRQKKEDLSPYWKRLSSNQINSGEEEGGSGETMNP